MASARPGPCRRTSRRWPRPWACVGSGWPAAARDRRRRLVIIRSLAASMGAEGLGPGVARSGRDRDSGAPAQAAGRRLGAGPRSRFACRSSPRRGSLIGLGAVAVVLPVPWTIPPIVAGVAVLGTECRWARRPRPAWPRWPGERPTGSAVVAAPRTGTGARGAAGHELRPPGPASTRGPGPRPPSRLAAAGVKPGGAASRRAPTRPPRHPES
jgi:hypothetical protein